MHADVSAQHILGWLHSSDKFVFQPDLKNEEQYSVVCNINHSKLTVVALLV